MNPNEILAYLQSRVLSGRDYLNSTLAGLKDRRWWPYLLLVAVAGLAMFLAYSCGQQSVGPEVKEVEKVVYKDRIVEKEVEKVVEKVVVKKVWVRSRKNNKQTVITVIERPDGTKETRKDIKDLSTTDESNNSTTDKENTKTVYVDRIVEKEVTKEVEKIVSPRLPQWRVGGGIGYDALEPFEGTRGIPGMQGVVIMVEGERRIYKGLWGGLWIISTGVLGIKLDGEF